MTTPTEISTTTRSGTTVPVQNPDTRDLPTRGRPRRLHATARGGIDVARELGVQYRAYCGRWVWPLMPTRDIKKRDLTDPSPRHCKDCVAVIQGRRRPA